MTRKKLDQVNSANKFRRRKRRRKILEEGEYLFSGGGETREGKGGKYLEKISAISVKDIEKSWFWSRSRDFCQFLEGFGEFGLGKKVSVSVSENLASKKKVSVSENLVSEEKSRYWFRSKFWYHHSVARIFGLTIVCI